MVYLLLAISGIFWQAESQNCNLWVVSMILLATAASPLPAKAPAIALLTAVWSATSDCSSSSDAITTAVWTWWLERAVAVATARCAWDFPKLDILVEKFGATEFDGNDTKPWTGIDDVALSTDMPRSDDTSWYIEFE